MSYLFIEDPAQTWAHRFEPRSDDVQSSQFGDSIHLFAGEVVLRLETVVFSEHLAVTKALEQAVKIGERSQYKRLWWAVESAFGVR